MKHIILATSIALLMSSAQAFDFGGLMESITKTTSETPQTSSSNDTRSDMSQDSISKGLKLALSQGVEYAVQELGKDGGYLTNIHAKIPLPEELTSTESIVRKMGGDSIADDFIHSMNTAASKSALQAAPIFVDAIEKMSIEDAKAILSSDESAATQYFKTHTSEALQKVMKPIIQETMQESKVTAYYDTFNEYYKAGVQTAGQNETVQSYAKSFGMEKYIPKTSSDEELDEYVTRNAMDGLFTLIAAEEAKIRKNPLAQTSSLLQKVFSN